MLEIIDNVCYKQSLIANKIEPANTQYPELIHVMLFFFFWFCRLYHWRYYRLWHEAGDHRGIHAGLGDILESQSMGTLPGQKKASKNSAKSTTGLNCVITLLNMSDHVIDARGPSLSISRKSTPDSWSQIGIDLMCTLMEIEGYRYILNVIDFFIKWFEFIAPEDDIWWRSRHGTLQKLIAQYGCPDIIISEEGMYVCKQDIHIVLTTAQCIDKLYIL